MKKKKLLKRLGDCETKTDYINFCLRYGNKNIIGIKENVPKDLLVSMTLKGFEGIIVEVEYKYKEVGAVRYADLFSLAFSVLLGACEEPAKNRMNMKEAKAFRKQLKKHNPDGDFDIVVHEDGYLYVIDFLVEDNTYMLIDSYGSEFEAESSEFTILKKR